VSVSGTRTHESGFVETATVWDYWRCDDVVGNREGINYLYIDKWTNERPMSVTGNSSLNPPIVYVFNNWPINWDGPYHLNAGSAEPSEAASVAEVGARTNPSRPEVSVPLILFELIRQIPDRIFDVGAAHIERLHPSPKPKDKNAIVRGEFGWNQLYKDVTSLFNFVEHVDQRVKEFNHLFTEKGLRRSRTVWTDKVTSSYSSSLFSTGFGIDAVHYVTTSRRKWVSMVWKPDNLLKMPDATEQLRMARRVVHGWDLSPATAWQALPWSWLVDYFTNIGDLLETTRNSIGVSSSRYCVMHSAITERVTTVTTPPISIATWTKTGKWKHETKSRSTPGGLAFDAHLPLLSVRQLTTLSSIALNYGGGIE